ncbi:hypothetical protein N7508_005472 [Penicillium antarcticum]|uniref:uncharacterized protein n=1 Tax=Penicillium antarcticum TaxID=416450 RepID=UPI0023A60484|nr:uncharacterized protein N7508_005472 [Penicillium antarcticum]KAJ5306457.1 hypothetical protein N7508_005472 [Penicillium antarcticum]
MASSVDAKLLRQTKFPPEFNRKVDMTKVNIEVMKKWIARRISEILGNEDDVVIEMCFGHLEGPRYPDIKSLQIQLTGFLDKDTPKFCQELWSLCLSGQANPQGVPKELLEAKKLELIQEKLDAEKAAEASRRQKEQEQNHMVEEVVAVEAETLTGDLPLPETGTMIVTVKLGPGVTSTRTFHPITAVVVAHLVPPRNLALDPRNTHPLAANVMRHARDPANAVAVPPAIQPPQTDADVEDREGAVRTTVTVLDPLPAAMHPAHVPPEETAADETPLAPDLYLAPALQTGQTGPATATLAD